MWTQPTMSVPETIIVSALGISVVFITLIVLALAIMVISKILRTIISGGAPQPAAGIAPVISDEADKETLAVLMAAIGTDLGLPADRFKIVDVKEMK